MREEVAEPVQRVPDEVDPEVVALRQELEQRPPRAALVGRHHQHARAAVLEAELLRQGPLRSRLPLVAVEGH
eukprot:10951606-Alexandrium_andersonii.AAC.1